MFPLRTAGNERPSRRVPAKRTFHAKNKKQNPENKTAARILSPGPRRPAAQNLSALRAYVIEIIRNFARSKMKTRIVSLFTLEI